MSRKRFLLSRTRCPLTSRDRRVFGLRRRRVDDAFDAILFQRPCVREYDELAEQTERTDLDTEHQQQRTQQQCRPIRQSLFEEKR